MKKIVLSVLLTIVAMLAASCSPVINASEIGTAYLAEAEQNKISEYTTEFNKKNTGRAKNIELASKAINGKVLNPGEEFSFNNAVGPTTRRNGFKKAIIFEKGKKTTGYGGGVCQVSSTLHNAVLIGNLETVELHHHSLPVFYVEEGKDAATSYGTLDYIFRNNTSLPVRIRSYVRDNKVTVAIYRDPMLPVTAQQGRR